MSTAPKPFKLALLAEDEFQGIESFATQAERSAYAAGFSRGGYCYGAGSCSGYSVPEELEDSDLDDVRDEIRDALAKEPTP